MQPSNNLKTVIKIESSQQVTYETSTTAWSKHHTWFHDQTTFQIIIKAQKI
jgi:hypothetical protein